mmetsp:Transcript_54532/g.127455  ORF Transcript_54532/g.127455 Transcript_54532/m.127455 type:complete len:858 (-) Transcript_54532:68-2641(-)
MSGRYGYFPHKEQVALDLLGDCAKTTGDVGGGFSFADDDAFATQRREAAQLLDQGEAFLKDEDFESCIDRAESALTLLNDTHASLEKTNAKRLMTSAYRLESIFQGDVRPEKALTYAKEQAEAAAQAGDKRCEAAMHLELASMFAFDLRSTSHIQKALSYAEEARDLFIDMEDKRMEGLAWRVLASINFLIGKPSGVLEAGEKALAIAIEVADKVAEAKALHAIALSYVDAADFERAVEKAKESATAYKAAGDVGGQAVELLVASMWCMQADKPHRAQAMAEEAVKLHKLSAASGSSRKASRHGLALMVLVEALIARRQERKALKVASEGAAWFERVGDERGKGYAMEVVIHALTKLGKVDDAIDKASEAVRIAQDMKDKRMEIDLLYYVTRAYSKRGDVGMAARTLLDIQDLAEEIRDAEGQASAMHEMAKLYLGERVGSVDDNSVSKAIRVANEARAIFRRADLRDEQASSMMTLAFGYLAQRDPARAANLAVDAEDIFTEAGWHQGTDAALNLQIEAYLQDERLGAAQDAAGRRKALWVELKNTRMLANACVSMAEVHLAHGALSEVETCVAEALKLLVGLEDPRSEAGALLLRTQALTAALSKEDPPDTQRPSPELAKFAQARATALQAAEEALDAAARAADRPLTGLALLWQARVFLYGLKPSSAVQVAKEAEKVFSDLDDRSGKAQSLYVVGNAHFVLNEREEAIVNLEESVRQAREAEDSKTAAQAQELIDTLTAKPAVAAQVVAQVDEALPALGAATTVAASAVEPARPKLDEVAIRKKITDIVLQVIASDEEIEGDSPLMDAGMDSLSSVQLVANLSKAMSLSIPPSAVFDYPTISMLVAYVVDELSV